MTGSYGISLGVSPREPLSRTSELARAIDESGFDALWYIDFQLEDEGRVRGHEPGRAVHQQGAHRSGRHQPGDPAPHRHRQRHGRARRALRGSGRSRPRRRLVSGAGRRRQAVEARRPAGRDRRIPPAVHRRGMRPLRHPGPPGGCHPPDPHLPGRLAARHAAPRRRDLRRRRADGRRRPRVLLVAARLHPRGPGGGRARPRGTDDRPVRDHVGG